MEIMVSIIVPVYNVETYIDKCLESIVNQTYKNIEIILINDGSTDGSGDVCPKWARKENLVYISKRNEGSGITRNLGISVAKGNYVMFVDSDDWLALDMVECMVNHIIEDELTDVIATSQYFEFDDKNKEFKKIQQNECIGTEPIFDVKRRSLYLLHGFVPPWGKLIRREFLLNNQIWMPAIPHEDNAVFPEIVFCANSIRFCEYPLYYYRVNRQGNVMSNYTNYTYMPDACENFLKYFKEHKLMELHYAAIKRYVETRLKYAYESYCENESNRDRQIEALDKSVKLYRKYFKNQKPFWEYRFALLGSFGSRWVIHILGGDKEQLVYHMPFSSVIAQMTQGMLGECSLYNKNKFRAEKVRGDIEGELYSILTDAKKKTDFFFLDFLEERYDVAELKDGNYITLSEALNDSDFEGLKIKKILKSGTKEHFDVWKHKCEQLVELLRQNYNYSQIILIKSRLAIQHQIGDIFQKYPGKKALEEKNFMIEKMENYFLDLITGQIQIYVYPDEIYTEENFRMGTESQYLGDSFYQRMAAEISVCFDNTK